MSVAAVTVSARLTLAAVASLALGVGGGFLLALPGSPLLSSWVRVGSDVACSLVLGFAVLAALDLRSHARRRNVDPSRMWRFVGYLAGVWATFELMLLVLAASEAAGQSVPRLSAGVFGSFVTSISVGRLGSVTVLLAVAVCAIAVLGYRRAADWSPTVIIVLSSVALVARPITGHMSQFTFGSILVAMHVLCAAIWFGVLGAMALSLRTRSAWSTLLPAYSPIALWCVVGVAATGIVNTLLKLDGPAALVETGYGRIVLAKIIVTIALVGLGRWIRRTWLVAAAAHRVSVDESLLRAGLHVCVLGVAFGLAAALATTA